VPEDRDRNRLDVVRLVDAPAVGERRVAKASKDQIAMTIVDTAEELLRERAG
jgi:hypothetical protein